MNKLYHVKEVSRLGFKTTDRLQIPDDYLDNQKFMIFRTAWGIGDWGIISSMPRLLKQKYPNCKVYVPSKNSPNILYQDFHQNVCLIFTKFSVQFPPKISVKFCEVRSRLSQRRFFATKGVLSAFSRFYMMFRTSLPNFATFEN